MFIVQIGGRLGKDPEVRFTPSGQKVTTFNIAVNQRKGKEDVTIWVRITVWGDRLDKIISYLKKGSAMIVIGRMNPPSSYVDKEGRTQFSLEVTAEMIEFSPFGGGDRQDGQGGQQQGHHHQSHEEDQEENSNPAYHNRGSYGAGTMAGQASKSATLDDDTLPF